MAPHVMASRPNASLRMSTSVLSRFLSLTNQRSAGRLSSTLRVEAMPGKVLICGGGNASGYAAREWVNSKAEGSLTIVGNENVVAYERPALSKAYLNPEGAPRLPGFHTSVGGGGERQEPSWYESHGITYKTGSAISAIDVAGKTATTASGETLSWDKLVLATGARAVTLADFKTPGADLSGVHYLRDVADADALIADFPACKERGGKAVCIGGGYIGMECAAGLQKNGLAVTMVFPEDYMMSRLFTPELAAWYESQYEAKGISFKRGTLATSLEGADGRVSKVVLKDGSELEASLVVVGVGARPNTDLLKDQVELLDKAPGGVKVNGFLQSSNPDVYAIGDVAAFPLKREGGALVRQEHVTNCRTSAAHAMKHIIQGGSVGEYDYLPFFYSRVFDLGWQFYGSSDGDCIEFGDKSTGKFGAYWVKDGTVVGAFMEGGSDDDNKALKEAAMQRPAAPDDLASAGIAFAAKL